MNIRHALEYAEQFLAEGKRSSAEGLISYAEVYLAKNDPDGTLDNVPIFCCFVMKGDIIHCGRTEDKPLFPGTRKERVKLCRECRKWCLEKIKELKQRLAEIRD